MFFHISSYYRLIEKLWLWNCYPHIQHLILKVIWKLLWLLNFLKNLTPWEQHKNSPIFVLTFHCHFISECIKNIHFAVNVGISCENCYQMRKKLTIFYNILLFFLVRASKIYKIFKKFQVKTLGIKNLWGLKSRELDKFNQETL